MTAKALSDSVSTAWRRRPSASRPGPGDDRRSRLGLWADQSSRAEAGADPERDPDGEPVAAALAPLTARGGGSPVRGGAASAERGEARPSGPPATAEETADAAASEAAGAADEAIDQC